MTPAQENERMLARVLGISEDEAATKLSRSVAITAAGGEAAVFAAELKAQLERTITVVGLGEPSDLEVTIHAPPQHAAPKTLTVAIGANEVAIGQNPVQDAAAPEPLHGVQRVLSACYAAGVVLAHLIDELRSSDLPDPFVIRFDALGANRAILSVPINLADAVLAGAGAVGNGFLYAARHLDISGTLAVVDPKIVGEGNPNRCLFFDHDDVGKPKAMRLAVRAQPDFPRLRLEPNVATFSDFRRARGRVRRVIVGTDSRRARRTIQDELPLEVLDASTTGITEVIVHSHRQPTTEACLACIYRHIPDEMVRERAIAEGLGIPLKDVTSGALIDARLASIIAALHPGLDATALIGVAFDSLYKQLCAEQTLLTAAGEQTLAPFAFVSNLAGALLAIELVRFDSGQRFIDGRNYLFASPWTPPHTHLRRVRPRASDCGFCGKPTARFAWQAVWPEIQS